MKSPPPLPLVAKALLLAAPGIDAATLAWPLAQSIGEGAWAAWTEGGETIYPFDGTNNFGAMHATRGFAENYAHGATLITGTPSVAYSEGWGMVAFLDHTCPTCAYVTRMAVYPSLFAGALDFLRLVERYANLQGVSDVRDYAAQLYVRNYFEGFHTGRTLLENRAAAYQTGSWSDDDNANISDYAALITRNVPAAQAALAAAAADPGDPTEEAHGPPFAPLAVRLTPAQGYAPHTLAHAATLLGDAAINPPAGAISLEDALQSPRGDGTWMFPEGISLPPSPAPAPELPVAVRTAEEYAALAALAGALVGAALLWAGLRFRPAWTRGAFA